MLSAPTSANKCTFIQPQIYPPYLENCPKETVPYFTYNTEMLPLASCSLKDKRQVFSLLQPTLYTYLPPWCICPLCANLCGLSLLPWHPCASCSHATEGGSPSTSSLYPTSFSTYQTPTGPWFCLICHLPTSPGSFSLCRLTISCRSFY